MKKQFPVFILVLALCFNLMVGTAFAAEGMENFKPVKTYTYGYFKDVHSDIWYYPNVVEAYEYDLVNGKGNNIFDPNGKLTVAEAIKLAACMHSIYYNGNVTISNGSPWYQPYVDYAKANGIITADFDNYNRSATRLEFAAIFAKALPASALPAINTVKDNAIPDVPYNSNYGDKVYMLYRAGILTGNDSAGTFAPNSNIVRSEVAAITTRMANPNLRRAVTLVGNQGNLTAEQISEQCSPAVFYLEIYDENGKFMKSGSGFFIDSTGLAVTNYHVIEDAASAKIMTTNGNVYNVQGVYDYDESRDIALLKIGGQGFSYLPMNTNAVKNGMTVYAIGSPQGLDNTISNGLVSNANRVINGKTFIQTSAPISNGSSGGALIDSQGRVIGVTTAYVNNGQNLNLAVPISAVNTLSKSNLQTFSSLFKSDVIDVVPNSVNITTGNTLKLYVYSYSAKVDTVWYQCLNGFENNVNCEWGDWSSDYGEIPLYITGLKSGSGKIKVYAVDSAGNTIGNPIIVNVNVSSAGAYSYYSGYYPAVDFGAYAGAPVYKTMYSNNGKIKQYYYDVDDITKNSENIFTDYTNVLKKQGFEYHDSYYIDDVPVIVMYNSSTKVFVQITLAKTSYSVFILIGLQK